MLKFLLGVFLGWLLFSGDCEAMKVAIVAPPPANECIAAPLSITALDALADARKLMMRDGWEYGGVIYADARGRLCISPPATSEAPTRLLYSVFTPEGYTVVGLYHTHPGFDGYETVFSGIDANSACRMNVPSWIVTENRAAFRFRPQPVYCKWIAETEPNIVPGNFVGMVRP